MVVNDNVMNPQAFVALLHVYVVSQIRLELDSKTV